MSGDIPSDEEREFLRQEYDSNISLFTHWDSQLWTKNRFFLLIESAFLGVTVQFVQGQLVRGSVPSLTLFGLFIFVSTFNMYLSYVWFRAVRRSREYIEARLERGKILEEVLQRQDISDDIWQSYNYQDGKLSDKGSSRWEISLPVVFLVVWFGAGSIAGYLVFVTTSFVVVQVAVAVWFVVSVTTLMLAERNTWFRTEQIRDYSSNLD